MKSSLLKLLSIGLLVGFVACSDDDDDDATPSNNPSGPSEKFEEEDPSLYNYYGAELYTKSSFLYGRFEAKMKMACAPGCISSMFLYYNDSYMGGSKSWNEVDIEVVGKNSVGFQSNIITGSSSRKITSEQIHAVDSRIDGDFHLYVMEWTPEYVAWFVDGKEVRRNIVGDSKNQVEDLVEEQSLRFNLWMSDDPGWVGVISTKSVPCTQYIDYVKVSSYNQETKEFSELWTDDFDSFDSSRWSRGNWGMDLVMEKPANVVVEDGVLQLKLTKELK